MYDNVIDHIFMWEQIRLMHIYQHRRLYCYGDVCVVVMVTIWLFCKTSLYWGLTTSIWLVQNNSKLLDTAKPIETINTKESNIYINAGLGGTHQPEDNIWQWREEFQWHKTYDWSYCEGPQHQERKVSMYPFHFSNTPNYYLILVVQYSEFP